LPQKCGAFAAGRSEAKARRKIISTCRKPLDCLYLRTVNQVLTSLKLDKHPDKTFIGRIEKGFDFQGYHFRPEGLSIAQKTVENFVARAIRLYEQEPGGACASPRFGPKSLVMSHDQTSLGLVAKSSGAANRG